MRFHTPSFAVATVSLALSLSGCASGKGGVGTNVYPAAAEQELLPEQGHRGTAVPEGTQPPGAARDDEEAMEERSEPHTDQVPGALKRMSTWPGLGDAVTSVVMRSPKGRIHGHEAERIDIEVDDDAGTARVVFVMQPSFKLHGDRAVACLRAGETWSCRDEG